MPARCNASSICYASQHAPTFFWPPLDVHRRVASPACTSMASDEEDDVPDWKKKATKSTRIQAPRKLALPAPKASDFAARMHKHDSALCPREINGSTEFADTPGLFDAARITILYHWICENSQKVQAQIEYVRTYVSWVSRVYVVAWIPNW